MAYTPPPNPSPLNAPIEKVVFIDIETVPTVQEFNDQSQQGQKVFLNRYKNSEMTINESWRAEAGMNAVFAKVCCISVGVIVKAEDGLKIRVKAFAGKDEGELLKAVAPIFGKAEYICGHNGKRFDFPFLSRRYLINGLPVPSILQTMGLKPWEVRSFDTLEMWQFGDMKNFTSLDALALAFDLPSPKDDVTGADVAPLYYDADDLDRIGQYCNKDVVTLINVYLRIIGNQIIDDVVVVE